MLKVARARFFTMTRWPRITQSIYLTTLTAYITVIRAMFSTLLVSTLDTASLSCPSMDRKASKWQQIMYNSRKKRCWSKRLCRRLRSINTSNNTKITTISTTTYFNFYLQYNDKRGRGIRRTTDILPHPLLPWWSLSHNRSLQQQQQQQQYHITIIDDWRLLLLLEH